MSATDAEVDAAIARHERAAALAGKAAVRAARLYRAVEMIELALGEGINKMAAYGRVGAQTGLSRDTTRRAWVTCQRFPRAAWEAALTPTWDDRERGFFVDSVPGLADFIAAIVIERKGMLPVAKVARVALAHFNLEARHRSAIERWARVFIAQNKREIDRACNPDRAKNWGLPAHGSKSQGASEPFAVVELDGSPADVLTRSGRRRLLVMIDQTTRAKSVIVADSENGDATGRLLFKFQSKYSLPRVIRTDRGLGFTSARMRVFLERLGIKLETVLPFSGQEKPFAESAVRILQQFAEYEPGFAGHNPVERMRLRGRLSMAERRGKSEHQILEVSLTDRELEQHFDRFLEIESERVRKELNGRSTNQVIACWQAGGGVARRCEDERVLLALLAPSGYAVVGKKGIRVKGATYIAPELAAFAGRRVEYREHADVDKLAIFTIDKDSKFICIAIDADALEPSERRVEALAARRVFRVTNAAIRAGARKLVKGLGGKAPAEIYLKASKANGEDKIVAIPFSTPALIEASKAARAEAGEPLDREVEVDDAVIAMDMRWAKFWRLKKSDPATLSQEDLLFLRVYAVGAEYRSRVKLGIAAA